MAKTKRAKFDLSTVVAEVLDDYAKEVEVDAFEVMRSTAPEAVEKLQTTSPHRTGAYAKGWTAEERNTKRGYVFMQVYNATDWQLTHLLENGHANRDGGRTKGQKHIAPVEKWTENAVVERIERKIKG